MSLSKIIEIANVGRFVECKNIELSDVNLIYAENGCGKSTLSAIMRAVALQEARIIDERSTLGNLKKPKVELLFNNDKDYLGYKKGAWTGKSPQFEVFDDIFVSENIFAGHEINTEHRTGLYEFAIGSLAVNLRNKEKEFDTKITDVDGRRNQLKDAISKKIIMDFNDFISLPVVTNLEKQITNLNTQKAAANANDFIQKKESLSKLDELVIDFDFYQELLKKTIDDISDTSEEFVKHHITHHMNQKGAENWLESGLEFIKDENCPFCGQTLNTLDLIKIYRDYFNKEYKKLKNMIGSAITDLPKLIGDNVLIILQQKLSNNRDLTTFWAEHLQIQELDFAFDDVQEKLQSNREKLISIMKQKLLDPLEPIENVIGELIDCHKQIISQIQEYNLKVEAINQDVANFKINTAGTDVEKLQVDLNRFEHTRKRFNDLKDECDKYLELEAIRSTLDIDRKKAKKDLDTENNRILEAYRTDINTYLLSFGADFTIKKDIDRRSKGKPRLMLKVVINDEEIDISKSESGNPNFKNTLSTGDKTSLALAFFFSKLKQMDETRLEETILVLDDPITSLGMHRREKTLNEIIRLVSRVKQLIVLSHEPYFLRDVYERISYTSKGRTLIQLAPSGSETKFITWQMKSTLKSRYIRHCENIRDFIENGSGGDNYKLEQVKSSIRIVLETVLENRFPTDLSDNDPLGTHISKIMKCDGNSNLNILKNNNDLMETLNELNQYSQPIHHSEGNHQTISERELIAYSKGTFKFIHGEIG